MKQTLNVEVQNYKINISDDSFERLIADIDSIVAGRECLFVVSDKVFKLYANLLGLENKNVIVIKDGEKQKNIKTYLKIISKATELNMTRNSVFVAIGGGVIGDITGFVASTYMRGVDYIQVPTTLLSMVDSSVGGKTALDVNNLKNVIGTFYQPKEVFININFLKTLDKKQFKSGLGEVLKYAFIERSCNYSPELFLFEYLTLCKDRLFELEPITVIRVIEYCLKLKIAVVNADEKEAGLRKILNLGHTLGHALEVKGKFRKYTHGEAVVQGIFFVFGWAKRTEIISYSYYRLATELLEKFGFKEINLLKKFKSAELVEIMKNDKKATSEKITFIIPYDKKMVKDVKFRPEEVLEMFS